MHSSWVMNLKRAFCYWVECSAKCQLGQVHERWYSSLILQLSTGNGVLKFTNITANVPASFRSVSSALCALKLFLLYMHLEWSLNEPLITLENSLFLI